MNVIKQPSAEEFLQQADWPRIYKELLAFAGFCYPKMPVDHRKELVSKTVEKVITGDQEWNPKKRPTLLNHLKLVFRSVSDGEFQSAYRKKRGYVSVPEGEYTVDPLETLPDANKPIDELCADRDLIELVLEAIKYDETAVLIMYSIMDGANACSEIAQDLEISEQEVRNGLRRIRYHGNKIKNTNSLET